MKYLIILISLLYSNILLSQSADDCMSNLSIFAEYYKVKNYDSAYEPWMEVRKNCPKINVAIYSGIIPAPNFIENLIKLIEDEKINVFLFGKGSSVNYKNSNIRTFFTPQGKLNIICFNKKLFINIWSAF